MLSSIMAKKVEQNTVKKMDKQSKILKKASVSKERALKKISKTLATKAGCTEHSHETGKLPDHHFKAVKVKRGLAGLGLFAGEDIKKGELIIEYIGNILNKEEADKKTSSQYLFEVSRNKTIDGTPRWNIARYANHSCNGNAESDVKKTRVFVKAIKNIKEGEEIVYDYGEEFCEEYIKPHGCLCIAKRHLYGMKGAELSAVNSSQ